MHGFTAAPRRSCVIDTKYYSLIKVVETGSYTKAARSLSLSQPAVSQHIRLLENELGIRIFERTHNRSTLTKEGKIVVQYVRRMVALQDHLERDLKNEKNRITSLTIGITHTAESNSIVEALAAYVNRNDGMNIKIVTESTDQLYHMLKNYELDFALVEGKVSDTSLNSILLDTDCLVLAVSPQHKLASRNSISISELKNEKLILRLPNSNTRSLFSTSLEQRNLSIEDFNVILEIDNIAAIKDLIRRDFGVSVLAKSACMDEIRKKKIYALSIENLSMEREINLVYTKDFEHPGLLQDIAGKYHEMRKDTI